jgi:hypothetical protein
LLPHTMNTMELQGFTHPHLNRFQDVCLKVGKVYLVLCKPIVRSLILSFLRPAPRSRRTGSPSHE